MSGFGQTLGIKLITYAERRCQSCGKLTHAHELGVMALVIRT